MKMRLKIAVLCCVLAAFVISGCARRAGRPSSGVQVKGSDTMVSLAQAWAEEFMKQNLTIRVAVTGGGSGTGIAALINGTTDIATASREMKQEEIDQAKKAGRDPKEFPVAIDAIVVAVNPKNPVGKLTIDQLSGIYTGKITNWSQVGGPNRRIVALSREKNSGTHVYFLEHVLRKGNAKGREQFAPNVLMLPSSQTVGDEVAGNVGAIGYFGLGWLDRAKHKAVAVANTSTGPYVSPTEKTAASGEYPISRKLYLYTAKEPAGSVKEFVDFALSEAGQKIVADQEFVPLKKVK
ncbi:MAG: PstS family phosphate ABC transporter substrate-binding protein [Armatimonadota bacterium]|nr:PstS family phosphate ABC transporter substrate-binding protein [Armatimonadota bacterium]